jgi:hypothetical protein
VVLDVQGFPAMLHWYLVHNRAKRLPPVAAAFKDFLLRDAAALIGQMVSLEPHGSESRARRQPANQSRKSQ